MTFEFEIQGEPCVKERARTTKKGFTFTPKTTANYENLVKLTYQQNKGEYYENRFLDITIFAYFGIPKSFTKKQIKLIEDGKLFPLKKDWDNIGKIICDGLQGIAYKNDSYIKTAHVYKLYTDKEPKVRVIMDIMEG